MKNSDKRKKENDIQKPMHPTMMVDGHIVTDPEGSWTGTPLDPLEEPVQDVDDL